MTKQEMIKELVKKWIHNAYDETTKKCRFYVRDLVIRKLDKRYYKNGIENIYNQVFIDNKNIDFIFDDAGIHTL